jgi:hypothetical protein
MKTILAITAAWSLSASLAHAQPAAQFGPPPVFKFVSSTDKTKGVIVFRERVFKAIPVVKEIVVIENGQQVTRKITEYETLVEERLISINAADSRVITPHGKQLPIDEVWKRVKANTLVFVSTDGNAPDQVYLRALNADTLVIIPPLLKRAPDPQRAPDLPMKKKT